jgi:sortase A
MTKNKKGLPLIIIGILFIISAICYTGYNYAQSYRAGKICENVVKQLDSEITSNSEYDVNKEMEMPIIKVDDNDYIGTIQIPSIQLDLPVMNSWSYANLSVAPCRFSGSIYTKDMVIAGHNYRSHFGKLRNVNIGDEVLYTDSDGNEFLYEVEDLEILRPTAVEEMENGDCDLTLFTCTIGAKTRLAVRCSLVSTTTQLL